MIEKHIKRFKENRDYVVKQSVKDWIKSNHIKEVLDLFGQDPECGDKRSKTRWTFFMKLNDEVEK